MTATILPQYTLRRTKSFILNRTFRSRLKLFVCLLCIPLLFLCIGVVTSIFAKGTIQSGRVQGQKVNSQATKQEESARTLPNFYPVKSYENRIKLEKARGASEKAAASNNFANLDTKTEKSAETSEGSDGKRMVVQGGEDSNLVARARRDKVKEMAVHAWKGYKKYAWGWNELQPISKQGQNAGLFGSRDMGATIVDSLDTLFIMGLMDEFNEAKEWIRANLNFDLLRSDVSVFEVNIRFVGGLLSAFALTGEPVFKKKALHIAQKLLPAFRTPSGIPYGVVHTGNGNAKNHRWVSGGSSILSELGTLHLEFLYLSDITGDPVFKEKVFNIRKRLREIHQTGHLYPNYVNPVSGSWGHGHTSLGAFGDSFYEYLIKAYIQSNRKDREVGEMYHEAIDTINKHLVMETDNGLLYIAESMGTTLMHKMEHLACFAGGMYALGAKYLPKANSTREMEIAKGIANTCHESYVATATGLGPDSFRISKGAIKANARHYSQRPEAVETWFYLWRLTKDKKYRTWAWDFAMALEQYCRVPTGGFAGLNDVYNLNSHKDDAQQSYFLAETLKYLYLIFSDDSLISLDEWVFNTEGHPLPIQDKNPFYRKAKGTEEKSRTIWKIFGTGT